MRALQATAPVVEESTAGEEQQQYLTFVSSGETFAIGILHIKEIIEYGGLTTVPMMPAFVRGVINLRGCVVPVVDLAMRFGRPATVPGRRTCIIIVEVAMEEAQQDIGVIVKAVNQVLEILPQDIEPAPTFGAKLRTEFLHGLGKVEGEFVIILNSDRVLSLDELAQLTQDSVLP